MKTSRDLIENVVWVCALLEIGNRSDTLRIWQASEEPVPIARFPSRLQVSLPA